MDKRKLSILGGIIYDCERAAEIAPPELASDLREGADILRALDAAFAKQFTPDEIIESYNR